MNESALHVSVDSAVTSKNIGLDSFTWLPFAIGAPSMTSVALTVTAGPVWSTTLKLTISEPTPAGVWLSNA